MKMKPTILLCLLAITFIAAEARKHNIFPHHDSRSPKKQAEKIIRELNLFPTLDANIVDHDPAAAASLDAPKLVETSFRFPHLAHSATPDAANSSVEDFGHHAGYYRLPNTQGRARMFYFFFESRSKNPKDPVVIWLTGGPGCSGSLALFYENGPFHLSDDLSLVWNDFGWDKGTNIIFLDQPTGTGFSYSSSSQDIRATSDEAALDFYDFLQAFFEKHPQYAKNDFYITGESYAGHYIPAFSAVVHQKNKANAGLNINLKGLAIGNGLTNPSIQYKAYPDFALDNKLIDQSEYDNLNQYVQSCEEEIETCTSSNSSSACSDAYSSCNIIFNDIIEINPGINYYDIRKKCTGSLCYDLSGAEKFLNEASVKQALGVPDDIEFVSCSTQVYDAMAGDLVRNYALDIPDLLQDGIKVLIYAGEFDLICNWLGNSRWVEDLKWSGQKGFGSAPEIPFKVDGVDAGLQKSYGGLTFLKVYKAGHLVPMDQPKASLEMLTRWIQSKPAPTRSL
ncbi:hypothetical protein ACS0TY_020758 [Phlomoides rotata]